MLTPENTKIQFIGKKPEGKHEGGFAKFSGKIELPSDDVSAAGISMEIEMDSTYSDDPKLTQHLLSPDFFGARTHPKSTFTSTSIDAGDSQDHYVIKGDLTLHGVTKAINFPAEIKLSKDESVAVRSQFTINRNDFGISYGPGKINDEVSISVTVGKPHK